MKIERGQRSGLRGQEMLTTIHCADPRLLPCDILIGQAERNI